MVTQKTNKTQANQQVTFDITGSPKSQPLTIKGTSSPGLFP